MVDFSLIIPTYNEAENIPILVPRVISVLEPSGYSFEILVVDDDSPDLTWKIAKECFKNDNRVKVIRRFGEKDLSASVLSGMGSAEGKYLGVIDADLQHDETILPKMIAAMEDHDFAVGSRKMGSYGEWSKRRRFISEAGAFISKLFINAKLSDPMSGFFIIRKDRFEEVSADVNPRGFKILLELVARVKNPRIAEIGYEFRNRMHGSTKMSGKIIQNFIFSLFVLKFGKYISVRFIKHGLVGVVGVFVNLIGQWIGQEAFGWKGTGPVYESYFLPSLAVALGYGLSVINNYVLNNIWTFREKKIRGMGHIPGFLKYNLVTLGGFIIQISVWRFFLGFFQANFPFFLPELMTYFCNLIGIAAATTWNYFLNKSFTWSID